MKNIKYLHDTESKYRKNTLETLQAYNKSKTGDRKRDNYIIYALKDNKIVGGLRTEQGWDWAYIIKSYYQDLNILKSLLNKAYAYYKENIVGFQHASNKEEEINDYLQCGFIVNGILPDYPKGITHKDMLNTEMNQLETVGEYDYIISKESNDENNKLLDKLVPKDSAVQTDIEFVALDNETFAGGVYGYIKNEYLYVSLLVVAEGYRGNNIATKLMDLIEKEAYDKGIVNMYLGTCEFQALGFYLKRNYKVTAKINDFPKGFEEYTLVKKYEA